MEENVWDGQAGPRWSICLNYSAEEALLVWAAAGDCWDCKYQCDFRAAASSILNLLPKHRGEGRPSVALHASWVSRWWLSDREDVSSAFKQTPSRLTLREHEPDAWIAGRKCTWPKVCGHSCSQRTLYFCCIWKYPIASNIYRLFCLSGLSITWYFINIVPFCFYITAHRPVSVHGQTPWGSPSRQCEGTVCIIMLDTGHLLMSSTVLNAKEVWMEKRRDFVTKNRSGGRPNKKETAGSPGETRRAVTF